MAIIALLLNSIVLIWTLRSFKFDQGIAQVFEGSCIEAEKINTWVHLGINALSTMLLSGSNYCMQILSAPTRKEVDKAHARKQWLDIGVPSVRNLFNVATQKAMMWLLLGLSSIPLHLMYNSVLFSTIAANEYDIIFATEAFFQGGPEGTYKDTHFRRLDDVQAKAKTWDRLERAECINAYAIEFLNTRRNLVAVVIDDKVLANNSVKLVEPYIHPLGDAYSWICDADDGISRYGYTQDEMRGYTPCSSKLSKVKAHADRWRSNGWDIDYCLSESVEGRCSLNFSLPIIIVVLVCNLLKALGMLFISLGIRDKPLITVGDAIDSFLTVNDPTTEGMCLASIASIKAGKVINSYNGMTDNYEEAYLLSNRHKISTNWKPAPIFYKTLHKRWSNATSSTRWWSCLLLFSACMIAVASLLGYGITLANYSNGISMSAASFAQLGIGAVHTVTLISGWDLPSIGGSTVIVSVLIANSPQPILSFIYLLFNGVFTSMFLAEEWSDFAHKRKNLRVSRPKTGQRSTYFLELPYRYAVPLMIFSGVLHWSVSQSIFLAQVASFDKYGELHDPAMISTCGYSPIAIVITLIVGTFLALFVSVLGLRKYKPGMPLAGSCSAAISAACHGRAGIDTTAPLQWGVTSEEGVEIGHCAFSDRAVRTPIDGVLYAGCTKRKGNRNGGGAE
jgi:hypothetical protein